MALAGPLTSSPVLWSSREGERHGKHALDGRLHYPGSCGMLGAISTVWRKRDV